MLLRFVFAAAVALCGAPAFAETVLNRGNIAEPGSLDPQKYSTTYEAEIQRDLFEALVAVGPDSKLIPGAAESWSASADGRTHTFKLRPGLKWSDGTAMSSADFVYGIRRAIDPKTHSWYANLLYNIKNAKAINEGKMKVETLGVGAPDAATVVIELIDPSPTVAILMSNAGLSPAPKHVIDKFGADWTKPGNMVSNGAYKLAAWRPSDHIRLVKNPHFRDAARVKIDVVNFYPTEDDAAAVKRLRAGELDVNQRFPPNEIDQLKRTLPAGSVRTAPSIGVMYLVPNFKKPPFDDARVRRALSLAIDREAIVSQILRNGELANYGVVAPIIPNYTPSALAFKGKPLAERQREARALLAAAGYTAQKPLTFELSHRVGLANKRVMIAVQDMFKAIGVEAPLLASDVTVHYAKLRVGDFAVADAGWFGFGPDPEYFTYLLLSGSTEINYGAYNNSAFDAKSAEAQRTMDTPKRMALFREAEAIALADDAIIPIYVYVNRSLVAPHVKGWVMNPHDFHPTRFLSIDKSGATAKK